jgi:hypothetical protein
VKTRFASLPATANKALPATTMDGDRYRPLRYPPATPARSPSTDLADYSESPDILHLVEQDAAVAGASTPSRESRGDTTRRGRGRGRGRGCGRAAVAAASAN